MSQNIELNKEFLIVSKFYVYYFWQFHENKYNQYFTKLEKIVSDKYQLEFFINVIFKEFLSDFSIRRNLKKGDDTLKFFLNELRTKNFFKEVEKGNTEVIESFNEFIKNETDLSNGRSIISLLSKFASMINPRDFSLLDRYSKQSLKNLNNEVEIKIKNESLGNYNEYIIMINTTIENNKKIISEVYNKNDTWKLEIAHEFFTKNESAFNRRLLDKYLLHIIDIKKIENNKIGYERFING